MDSRLREWLNRYLVPELLGLFGAYFGLYYCYFFYPNNSDLVGSIFATWGENLSYYSRIFYKDYQSVSKKHPEKRPLSLTLHTAKGILFEFGIAEALDSFLFRPLCIFSAIGLLGDNLGVLVGKLIADVIFYLPTIFFYELRKKREERTSQK